MGIRDIFTGIKRITTGKSAYQQKAEAQTKSFKKVETAPGSYIQTTSGPVRTFTSGGGGGSSSAPAPAPTSAGSSYTEQQQVQQVVPTTPPITDVQRIQQRNEQITYIKNQAREQGVDISTEARARGFIKNLSAEEKKKKRPTTIKEVELMEDTKQTLASLEQQKQVQQNQRSTAYGKEFDARATTLFDVQKSDYNQSAVKNVLPKLKAGVINVAGTDKKLSEANIQTITQDIQSKGYSEIDGVSYTVRNNQLYASKNTASVSERKFIYGGILGTDPSLYPLEKYRSGEEFSVRYGHIFAGRKIAEALEKRDKLPEPPPEYSITGQAVTKVAYPIIAELPLSTLTAPFFKSTTATEKELFETTDVLFTGTSQKQSGNVIETNIKYRTSKGGKGYAKGYSQFYNPKDSIDDISSDILFSKSAGAGTKIQTGIKFPSGKPVTKIKGSYVGQEASVNLFTDDVSYQISAGLSRDISKSGGMLGASGKGKIDSFSAISMSKDVGDDLFISIGGLKGGGSPVRYGGIIKKIPTTPKKFDITFDKSFSSSNSLSNINALKDLKLVSAEASLKNIVLKNVQGDISSISSIKLSNIPLTIPAETKIIQDVKVERGNVINQLNSNKLSMTGSTIKQLNYKQPSINIPKTKQPQVTMPKSSFKEISIFASSSLSKTKQKEEQKTKMGLKELSKMSSIQKPRTKTQTKQRQSLGSLFKFKTPQLQKTRSVSYFPKQNIKIKNPPLFPPLKVSKKKTQRIPKSSALVSVRRFGEWKPLAKASSLSKAFSLGKGYTGRTLGASFKVSGVGKIPGIPKGYYSKQEKGSTIFIEKSKRRLSTKSELDEIFSYKRASPKRRKRSKKK